MESIPVLYDGWPLLHHPDGPASTHLFTLLQALPESVDPLLALPGPAPAWLESLRRLSVLEHEAPGALPAQWRWEQRALPGLARRAGARLIHLTHSHPALLSGTPTLVSPTSVDSRESGARRVAARLRHAAAQGGMARLTGLCWPEDLPEPIGRGQLLRLPPLPLRGLRTSEAPPASAGDLPENFLLAHGLTSTRDLTRLLDAWSWAAGPIGELYPLVVLGLDQPTRQAVRSRLGEYGLEDAVVLIETREPAEVAAIYRRCTAVFHPAAAGPWGSPVRNALAAGKPLVTTTDPPNEALVGPAAYTVPASDPRRLGAALITIIVEEEVAERLSEAARRRAAGWSSHGFGEALVSRYRQVLKNL